MNRIFSLFYLILLGLFGWWISQEINGFLKISFKAKKIEAPICPVYQNVNAQAVSDPNEIKKNLVLQLTGAVKWTQIMQNMLADGCTEVIEVGPGKVLQGLFKKVSRDLPTSSAGLI